MIHHEEEMKTIQNRVPGSEMVVAGKGGSHYRLRSGKWEVKYQAGLLNYLIKRDELTIETRSVDTVVDFLNGKIHDLNRMLDLKLSGRIYFSIESGEWVLEHKDVTVVYVGAAVWWVGYTSSTGEGFYGGGTAGARKLVWEMTGA